MVFGLFKKERKGALPPPPPPLMDELPPLPSLELERPPEPVMPTPPQSDDMEPFSLPELPPLEEAPRPPQFPREEQLTLPEEVEIPIVKAEALPEPREVEARYQEPLVVQDRTMKTMMQTAREQRVERPAYPEQGPLQVEERTFTQEVRQLATPSQPMIKKEEGTAFISVGDYQEMMEHLSRTQTNIEESEQLLARLTELTNTEESLLDEWRGHLEDMEKKLSYVDQVIFEGE